MSEDEGVPKPMTAEQILQDLKNAPKTDVVFTTLPGNVAKGKGLEGEVDKIASDSARLVEAYDKLKNCHRPELPKIIDEVEQQIANLTEVLSASDRKTKFHNLSL